MPHVEHHAYGFKWGALNVKRAMIDDRGGVHVFLQAGGRQMTVYASRTGRAFIVYAAGGRSLRP